MSPLRKHAQVRLALHPFVHAHALSLAFRGTMVPTYWAPSGANCAGSSGKLFIRWGFQAKLVWSLFSGVDV